MGISKGIYNSQAFDSTDSEGFVYLEQEAKRKSEIRRKDKFTRKYMKIARTLAEDNDACYSRKIGVVLIGANGSPLSFGYNGSVEGNPHNDSKEYLHHLYQDLLSEAEKQLVCDEHGAKDVDEFCNKFTDCKQCPRRFFNYPSGIRLDLCNCSHAERNAIFHSAKSGGSTIGATMYCYCGVPCHECSIAIINAKIARVVCLKTGIPDYSPSSRWMLAKAGVELEIISPDWIDLKHD